MSRDRLRALVVVVSLGSMMWVGGCRGESTETDARVDAGVEEQVVPVETVLAQSGTIEETILSTANVEARHQATLVAESTGVVERVHVEEGDTVSKGALLAELRNQELQIAKGTAASNVSRIRREMKNLEPLLDKGYVPRQSMEELEGQLAQAKDQLARMNHQVSNLRARAPLDGVVARRSIQPGQQVTVGSELFYVVDPSALVVVVHVPERALGQISEGATARIESDALSGLSFEGKIELISPVVNAQTGTVKVTLEVAARASNSSDPGQKLRPGMFVSVRIVVDRHESAVLIPKRAVIYEDNQPWVYVVEQVGGSPIARKIPVELGFSEEFRVEVKRGVEASQEVIVLGQTGLKDQTSVSPVETKSAAMGELR